jgi:ATP-dependent DNA helicase RecG
LKKKIFISSVEKEFATSRRMLFADRLEIWNPGSLPSELTLSQLKNHHGSYPFNPLLCIPMYLSGYIEKLGTGTQEMIKLCKNKGLKEPNFNLDYGFKITIWRNSKKTTGLASIKINKINTLQPIRKTTRQVAEEIRRVILVLDGEVKRAEIQTRLQLKHTEYFRVNYLLPSIDEGYVEITLPDVPNSPNQKYRLTKRGKLIKQKIKNN